MHDNCCSSLLSVAWCSSVVWIRCDMLYHVVTYCDQFPLFSTPSTTANCFLPQIVRGAYAQTAARCSTSIKTLGAIAVEWPLFQTMCFNCRWVVLGFGNSVSSCLIRKKWCASRATTKKLHPRFAGYLFQASHVAPWHKYFRMQPMAPKLSEKTWRDFIMSSSTWVNMLNLVGTSMLGSLDSAMIRKVAKYARQFHSMCLLTRISLEALWMLNIYQSFHVIARREMLRYSLFTTMDHTNNSHHISSIYIYIRQLM